MRRQTIRWPLHALIFSVACAITSFLAIAPGLAQGDKITTVRLADQPGAEVDYAAVWIAELLGYYEKEGIKIDRSTYPNGPAGLLDFASESVDAEMAAIVPFMQFAARGGEFKLVMSLTKGNAALVGKKEYTSYKGLNGKKVGTPGLGTIHDAVLGYAEQSQGLKFDRVFGKITDIAVMIEKGEVEAFIGWEPASAAAIAQAPQLLHYVAQLPPIPNSESLSLIFQPKIAKENPELIVRFLSATLRGIEFIKNNPKEKTAELIAKKMNNPAAVPVVLTALGSVILTDPRIDMPSSRILLQTIAKQGKIPAELVTDVDGWIGKYLDYSFLDKAQAGLKQKM
jgi:ABC-type nitrate/sulfonate/bicarbonate transport system substrate-binding protein